jgi:glutathione synthase/RimK-type ligase-like ATP-grasp enzyme
MRKKILTSSVSWTSAKLLRDALEKKSGNEIFITDNPEKVKRGILIRYGNSAQVHRRVDDTEFNPPDFVNFCVNKGYFSDVMNAVGIYTPEYHNDTLPNHYPVLIRKTLTGSGGRGIVVVRDEQEFLRNWNRIYKWTQFLKTNFEARVHVLDGKIARLFVKEPEGEEGPTPIRNIGHGYHFSLREDIENKYSKLKTLIQKVIAASPKSHFFAADVGYDPERKEYVVFELNSAPGLNENTADIYAQFLVDKIGI